MRGASKSAPSRHLVARMTDQLREQLKRRLDELELLVLMFDGIEVAHRTVVVALGILSDGRKAVLGLWLGSTENAALCTALLNDLLERGLKIEGRILCVIDGGRGIRKALSDVLGDLAVVQRCKSIKNATSSTTCRPTVNYTSRECWPRPGTAIQRGWRVAASRLYCGGWNITAITARRPVCARAWRKQIKLVAHELEPFRYFSLRLGSSAAMQRKFANFVASCAVADATPGDEESSTQVLPACAWHSFSVGKVLTIFHRKRGAVVSGPNVCTPGGEPEGMGKGRSGGCSSSQPGGSTSAVPGTATAPPAARSCVWHCGAIISQATNASAATCSFIVRNLADQGGRRPRRAPRPDGGVMAGGRAYGGPLCRPRNATARPRSPRRFGCDGVGHVGRHPMARNVTAATIRPPATRPAELDPLSIRGAHTRSRPVPRPGSASPS